MPYKALQRLLIDSTLLTLESQVVVGLRLSQFALGGPGVPAEARRMVTEKVAAAIEAAGTLAAGGSPHSVCKSYRRKVRANARRLRRTA
jgi:hypothetical protein